MFKLKIINKPKMIKMKCNIEFPNVVLANMQEKEITPTKETQIVEPDKNYDGLKKVTVNKIPDEYIIPTGEIQINQNGIYNVKDKVTADVNIPEKQLGTKTITKNGIYKATDDNLDGYSEVEVETSGVDINDYFETNYTGSNYTGFIKKVSNKILIKGTSCNSMFQSFKMLSEIPQLDTSKVTNMGYMFYECKSLTTIPQLDTSNVTNMNGMFSSCSSLTTIPQLDTSKVTNMKDMFYECKSLTTIPQLDTSNVSNMYDMFFSCTLLTTIPQLDTSNVTNMYDMFFNCTSLTTIPQLDTSKVTNIQNMFNFNKKLTNMGGLKNLGMAYLTTQSANYYQYTLNLSSATKLTHESLMNVINNLYDIASKGCNAQSLVLGSTNIAKLTAEEIAIATNKGWAVS